MIPPLPYPRVMPTSEAAGLPVRWLREVILGTQVPHLVDTQSSAQSWADMTLPRLAETLGKATRANLIVSPTGVVGYYNTGLVQVAVRDGRVWGKSAVSRLQPHEEIELPHVQVDGNLGGYAEFFQTRDKDACFIAPGEHIYLRTCDDILPKVGDALARAVPTDTETLQSLSVYWSQTDTVTNLHWDATSGVIQQVRGRKRVILFPPSEMANLPMYPLDHIFARRSMINGRIDAAALQTFEVLQRARGLICDIEPGQWLYTPAGWLHHVTTCDDDCISLIVSFKR